MYHDQVLIPFKTLFGFDAINLTLGLKYLRFLQIMEQQQNLLVKIKLHPKSLINCIHFLDKFN